MHIDLSSLQGKITIAYLALVIGTSVLAVIALLDLMFLERQVREGEIVTDLKDAVLEMRREEKNLFLYADVDAGIRADQYANSSITLIRSNEPVLSEILEKDNPRQVISHLEAYQDKLRLWPDATAEERHHLEQQLRTIGHRVYLAMESLSKQERKMLETAIQGSQRFLLACLVVIGLSIYFVGRQLKRLALNPLKKLESRLESISDGRFDQLLPPSEDREFIAFTDAFNRMLKELEVRQRRMMQSEKLASLGILASGVAHELNNPLSNISSSCQLLLEELNEADPEQLQRWLKQIDSETERGKKIVRTLLDFGGQKIFEKSPVKLVDLIHQTQSLIAKTIQQQSAELKVNIPDNLTVVVDKQRFLQLFINLIQNALNAGGPGAHVRISAMECDKGVAPIPEGAEVAGNINCASGRSGRFIEILVADDGPGVPGEQLSKVFDPFYTTSEPGQGVGLGLFIAQEIVREHEGCLAIASKPGKGAQVIALLPAAE